MKNEKGKLEDNVFSIMKLCKYQQYTFREGSFVFKNLCSNFRVSLLLTVHFATYFHAKRSFLKFIK